MAAIRQGRNQANCSLFRTRHDGHRSVLAASLATVSQARASPIADLLGLQNTHRPNRHRRTQDRPPDNRRAQIRRPVSNPDTRVFLQQGVDCGEKLLHPWVGGSLCATARGRGGYPTLGRCDTERFGLVLPVVFGPQREATSDCCEET